jgi:hypothetical protein
MLDCGAATLSPKEAQQAAFPEVEPGVKAPYEVTTGARVCFAVDNAADVALSVTLLDCFPSGSVVTLGEARIPKGARHTFWWEDALGVPFEASLSEDRRVGVDRVVAVGTTRPDVSLRYLESPASFASILSSTREIDLGDRDLGGESAPSDPPAESWTSALTAVRVVRAT